jgi:hypothetical protein
MMIHIHRKEFNVADSDLSSRAHPDLINHFHARARSAKDENGPWDFHPFAQL